MGDTRTTAQQQSTKQAIFCAFVGLFVHLELNLRAASSFELSPYKPSYHLQRLVQTTPPTTSHSFLHSHHTLTAKSSSNEIMSAGDVPVWDPVAQIYIGGVVPGDHEAVQRLLEQNDGTLRLFGYGSLCWNPGTGVLAHDRVTQKLARIRGYRRCWAQRSTDHRGTPQFPGVVCTLLSQQEVQGFLQQRNDNEDKDGNIMSSSTQDGDDQVVTEGLLYEVPPDLVEECLAELDFREKGGYARNVIDVQLVDKGSDNVASDKDKMVQALLYRGTLDNPAMGTRLLVDLPLTAAIMSVAHGPSGPNDVYLYRLNEFLHRVATVEEHHAATVAHNHRALPQEEQEEGARMRRLVLEQWDDTDKLSSWVELLSSKYLLHFLFGCGSNQHNQLLMNKSGGVCDDKDEVHALSEMVLAVKRPTNPNEQKDRATRVFAGSGNGALLTERGKLYMFGWNEDRQCASSVVQSMHATPTPGSTAPAIPVATALAHVGPIKTCALGFGHSLVVEADSGRLLAFGNNWRGQVTGEASHSPIQTPTVPQHLTNDCVVDVACGLFHSAAVCETGELIVFGSPDQVMAGNCDTEDMSRSKTSRVARWRPDDGAKVVRVACGRKHTIALDDRGRLWSFGDNKYGQLGRSCEVDDQNRKSPRDNTPRLILGPWEVLKADGWAVEDIICGWSHTVVLVRHSSVDSKSAKTRAFGFGRNDKGQLGMAATEHIERPIALFEDSSCGQIASVSCGSEFTVVLETTTNQLWACGWNEHGNLAHSAHCSKDEGATRSKDFVSKLCRMEGSSVTYPPEYPEHGTQLSFAAGGAHVYAMWVMGTSR